MSPGDLAQKPHPIGLMSTEVKLRLESGPAAVSEARRVLDPLETELGSERVHEMRLLVSELVTNSVRHAAGDEVELTVRVNGSAVHVCVTDDGPGFEVAERAPDDDPASGWGLFLVDQLSDRWGVELNGATRVWFELEY